MNKVLVMSDWHYPFMDMKAYDIITKYAKDIYKPNYIILGGDLIDLYSLSLFDKNPERASNLEDELNGLKEILSGLRKKFPKTKIYYLEGNHESRLQKYLWRHPELSSLSALKLDNLLDLKRLKINYIGTSPDYWKKDAGHLVLGDFVIMHGDNRLNGARYSQYSGYSAKNTMMTFQNSTMQGHTHRLGLVFNSSIYKQIMGAEVGCVCLIPGTSNWQCGMLTYEFDDKVTTIPRLYYIKNGTMFLDGKKYSSSVKNKEL